MSEQVKFLLLGIAAFALLAVCYRFRVIGVRGAGVDRDENPIAYWIAMAVLAFSAVTSLALAVWLA